MWGRGFWVLGCGLRGFPPFKTDLPLNPPCIFTLQGLGRFARVLALWFKVICRFETFHCRSRPIIPPPPRLRNPQLANGFVGWV